MFPHTKQMLPQEKLSFLKRIETEGKYTLSTAPFWELSLKVPAENERASKEARLKAGPGLQLQADHWRSGHRRAGSRERRAGGAGSDLLTFPTRPATPSPAGGQSPCLPVVHR